MSYSPSFQKLDIFREWVRTVENSQLPVFMDNSFVQDGAGKTIYIISLTPKRFMYIC